MTETATDVRSTPAAGSPVEGRMPREDIVREVLARLSRGEGVKTIARELGLDKKTVKRWRARGAWRPRLARTRPNAIDPYRAFLVQRGPEVEWNGRVLLRELRAHGFTGGYQQVQRALQPLRTTRRWVDLATVRFETPPGEQAQVDFGQLRLWIGETPMPVHLLVVTLGYSRRIIAYAYRDERLDTLLDGHERAFRHFGGVPLTCLYDNPRTITLGRTAGQVLWHPRFEDFARYYGFTPRACQPYRADQRQGGKRREIRQGQCVGRPALRALDRARRLARRMGRDGGRRPCPWDQARATDRSLHARDPHATDGTDGVSLHRRPSTHRRRRCARRDRREPVLGAGALCRPDRGGARATDAVHHLGRRHLHCPARKGRPARPRHGAVALPRPAASPGRGPSTRQRPAGIRRTRDSALSSSVICASTTRSS
jgi:transposase